MDLIICFYKLYICLLCPESRFPLQGSAPITGLSETSSDSEDSEVGGVESQELMDFSKIEKVFFTGALDELKIRFNYSSHVCTKKNSGKYF